MHSAAEQLQAAAESLSRSEQNAAYEALDGAFESAKREGDVASLGEVERLAMALAAETRGRLRSKAGALAADARVARKQAALADNAVQGGVIGPALIIAGIACVLLVVGSFGPWAKTFAVSVSGTDGSNDGWVTVAAAVLGFIAVWRRYVSGLRGSGLVMTAAAALGTAISIYDRQHVQRVSAQHLDLISVGWGLNLTLAASVVLGLCGLRFLVGAEDLRLETAATAAPPSAPRPSATRFAELADLRQKGLITDEEYEAKRAALLADV